MTCAECLLPFPEEVLRQHPDLWHSDECLLCPACHQKATAILRKREG